MIYNNLMLFSPPIVKIRVRVRVVRCVRITNIDQSTLWQQTGQLRLWPCVDAVEELGERDRVVTGAADTVTRDGIFLVRAQIWRRDIATGRRRRRRRVS